VNIATQLSSVKIPIVLIKEFAYCPRIAFYKYFTVWEPPTESMKFPQYTKLHLARILRSYAIEGDIYMEHPVRSKSLGVYGKVDAVVIDNNKLYIVEVKLDTSKSRLKKRGFHHLLQLTAYTIAAEETFHMPTEKSFIVVLARGEVLEVKIGPNIRKMLTNIVKEMKKYIEQQTLPPKTPIKSRCNSCFYRKACM